MPKLEKSTDRGHKLISSEDGQDTSACKISGHSLHAFSGKCPETSPAGQTDRQTDRHAVKRSRLVKWTNGPMYRSKEGISGFGRTDGRTDGQPENIMPKGGGIKIKILIPQVLVNTILHIQAQYNKNQIKPEGTNLIWKKAERRRRTARHHYDEPHWTWSADNVGNRAKKKYLNRFLLKWMIDWLDLMSFLTEKSHIRQLSQHPTLTSRPCWQRKRLDQFT